MSVHQLTDGRWIVAYRKNGKQTREYFGRGAAAEKQARKRNDQLAYDRLQRKRLKEPAGPTVVDLAQAYFDALRLTAAPSTIASLDYKLSAHLLPALGAIPAPALTHQDVNEYVRRRLRDVSKTTVNDDITYLKRILTWGVEQGLIKTNPVERYRKPARDNEIIQPATQAEVQAILDHAAAHLRRALLLSLFLGIRPGEVELSGLTWNDVDFRQQTIMIRSAKKGGLRFRKVPVHTRLMVLLKRWHKLDGDDGYIIRYHGKPVKRLKTAFGAAKKRAGITRRLRLYDFRHGAITAMLAAGADLKAVSEIAGHTDPSTTVRVYQHTNAKMHRASIDTIPAPVIRKNW